MDPCGFLARTTSTSSSSEQSGLWRGIFRLTAGPLRIEIGQFHLLINAVAVYNVNCSKVLIREWTYKVSTRKRAFALSLCSAWYKPRVVVPVAV
jgi:hypothetical protein